MDTGIVTTRMIGMDAISNFTMASAAALSKLGEVTVHAFAYERPAIEGVDVRFLGDTNGHSMGANLKALLGTFRLARELARHDVLIIVNPDVGSMPACHLAKRYNPKLKVMWTFHGLTPVEYVSGARDRWLMRIRKLAYVGSMKRAGLVKVDSSFVKGEVSRWGVDPARVTVMPLGIDLGRMAGGDGRRVREKYGIGDEFLLLYVGRLVRFKHADELARAAASLDGVRLLVVGGGPERERLEALVRELHAEGRVKFAGVVADGELPDYYAASDALASASRHEGFCVPIIEAMAAGKPAIVPEVGAMPETMGDAGLTYVPGDLPGLCRQVGRLRSDKGLYQALSKNALARASAFRLENIVGRYADMVKGFACGSD